MSRIVIPAAEDCQSVSNYFDAHRAGGTLDCFDCGFQRFGVEVGELFFCDLTGLFFGEVSGKFATGLV
jgi:hypothetical protein